MLCTYIIHNIMYMHGYYELQYTTDHVMLHIHVHIIYTSICHEVAYRKQQNLRRRKPSRFLQIFNEP